MIRTKSTVRPFTSYSVGMLFLVALPWDVVGADSLQVDESAIAVQIEALYDKSSDVREVAAQALRAIVAKHRVKTSNIRDRASGEAYWMEKINQIQPGMKEADVLKILPPFPKSPEESGIGSGQSHSNSHRLDHHWIVIIPYRNPDTVLERPTLNRCELLVRVAVPENYTGQWTNWYVNGQKGCETQYRDGKRNGVATVYYDNGQKSYEQHYSNGTIDGDNTGWHSDGTKSSVGRYRNGKQHGLWMHWYANGQNRSETNYKNGEYDGPRRGWHPNGQLESETNYRNGVQHGLTTSWNDRGVINYQREYFNGSVVERGP